MTTLDKNWLLRFALIVTSLAAMTGCVTSNNSLEEGTQPKYLGYVPTRIVVFPCRAWPTAATTPDLPPSQVAPALIKETCQVFDTKVLQSFENQPYMNGLSPKALQRALDGKPEQLTDLDKFWQRDDTSCLLCSSAGAFYQNSIAARGPWREWLQKIAQYTKDGDAILIPFVVSMLHTQYSDRGLAMQRDAAAIALLLIDSRSGQLMWYRSRTAILEQLAKAPSPEDETWKLVQQRLWIPYLWDGFPGRISNTPQ